MSFNNQYDETVSVGDWIGSIIVAGIPLVGLIMALVWAFGSTTKPSKRNFFRAWLLLAVIGAVLGAAVAAVGFALGFFSLSGLPAVVSYLD